MHVGFSNVIRVRMDFRFLTGYKMSVKYTLQGPILAALSESFKMVYLPPSQLYLWKLKKKSLIKNVLYE